MGNEIAGDLIVSEDVIADVAGHAALECYGVVGMAAPNAADGLAKILPQSRLRRGIVVSSDEEGTTVSLYVILEHGVNINVVSTNLAEQVTFALKEFVRTPLKGVEVHVQGIKVREDALLRCIGHSRSTT